MNLRALILFLVPLAVHANYQAGLDAFYSGEYEAAMQAWLSVVEGPPGSASPGEVVESQYAIAMLYWNGIGVPQDYGKAHDWLIEPAKMGHPDAQAKLGVLYSHGTGVELDYLAAFEWFSKAARQGNIDAIYNLGVLYLNGWGTERNTTMAKQYLAEASALGDIAAEKALQQLLAEPEAVSAVTEPGTTDPRPEPGPEQEPEPEPEPKAEPEPQIETDPFVLADNSWILNRPPEHYTIQVIALSTREKINALLDGHESLAPFALYTLTRDGRTLFVLLQGDYPSKEAAMKVRDAFPHSIQGSESLWIRQFGQIQSLIER